MIKMVDTKQEDTKKQQQRNLADAKAASPKTLTLDAIKLAVALELKLNGYTYITFDKTINMYGKKAKIHVTAEDELGVRYAVICINNPAKLDPDELIDMIRAIQPEVGDGGEVAIAIPIDLIDEAKDVFGLTRRMFLVDYELRVWISTSPRSVVDLIKAKTRIQEPLKEDAVADISKEPAALLSTQNTCYVV